MAGSRRITVRGRLDVRSFLGFGLAPLIDQSLGNSQITMGTIGSVTRCVTAITAHLNGVRDDEALTDTRDGRFWRAQSRQRTAGWG
jgi:hypothetical protein